MASIILLSGPVGAGKSTVAPALVAALKGPVGCIEGDVFWSFIARTPPKHSRQQSFRMIMGSMMAAALPFARHGFDAILDFSIPPWWLDTAKAIAAAREVPLHYVALCPSEAACVARAAARAAGTIKDYAPYRSLYEDFDADERTVLRDDFSDPVTVASRIAAGLERGEFLI
jgi:adenylate kinase family enzyme